MCVQTMNEHNIGCAVTNLLIKDGALEDMRDMKLAFGAACIETLHAKTKISGYKFSHVFCWGDKCTDKSFFPARTACRLLLVLSSVWREPPPERERDRSSVYRKEFTEEGAWQQELMQNPSQLTEEEEEGACQQEQKQKSNTHWTRV